MRICWSSNNGGLFPIPRSSVARITKGMSQASVQAIGYEVIDKGDERELLDIKLPSGRKLRMGIVDGHHAGNV